MAHYLQPIQKEVKAAVALLEQDWETPEQLAEQLIKALDEARNDREMFVAVLQFGQASASYLAVGPFAGRKSAVTAVKKFPGATLARKIVVVPLVNQNGMDRLMREAG